MHRLILASLALMLGGCQASGDMDAAEAQVAAFHSDYDAQRFDPMFDNTSPTFREITAREPFVAFLTQTRKQLGPVKSTKRTGWKVNYNTGGSQVLLAYETTFAHGIATETFTYDTGDPPRLLGYNLNTAVAAVPAPVVLAPGPVPSATTGTAGKQGHLMHR